MILLVVNSELSNNCLAQNPDTMKTNTHNKLLRAKSRGRRDLNGLCLDLDSNPDGGKEGLLKNARGRRDNVK